MELIGLRRASDRTEFYFLPVDDRGHERHALSIAEADSFSDEDEDNEKPFASGPAPPVVSGVPVGDWPLRLVQDASRGRFFVAARDLRAGELVCAEEPFVQTVHDALHDVVCHHCYDLLTEGGVLFDGSPMEARKQSRSPSSCERCAQVRYCSAECARDGATAHGFECDVLRALAARSALFMELLQAQLVDLGLQRERGAAAREASGPPSDTRLAVVSYEHLLAQPAAALAGPARDIAFPGGPEPPPDAPDLQNATVAHVRALATTTSDANDDVWHAVEATLCTSASGGEAVREACARSLAAWSPRRAAKACARASDLLLRAELDSQASTTPVPSEVAAHARRAFSAREWPLFPE